MALLTAGCVSKEEQTGTPVSNAPPAGTETKNPVAVVTATPGSGTPTQNGKDTTGTVITTSERLSRWGPLFSIDNIPTEIKLPGTKNLYATNLKFSDTKISGYIKNTGTEKESVMDSMFLISPEGSGGGKLPIILLPDGINEISPSQSKYFEIVDSRDTQIKIVHAKYFNFKRFNI